jgi:hypothetical protein
MNRADRILTNRQSRGLMALAGLQCQANITEKGKIYEKKSGFVD